MRWRGADTAYRLYLPRYRRGYLCPRRGGLLPFLMRWKGSDLHGASGRARRVRTLLHELDDLGVAWPETDEALGHEARRFASTGVMWSFS